MGSNKMGNFSISKEILYSPPHIQPTKQKPTTVFLHIFIALGTVGEDELSAYYPEFGQNIVLPHRRWI